MGKASIRYPSLERQPKPSKVAKPWSPAKHARCMYRTSWGERVVAIVRTMHKDGDATVTACYRLNDEGINVSGWLGYKYRMPQSKLEQAP